MSPKKLNAIIAAVLGVVGASKADAGCVGGEQIAAGNYTVGISGTPISGGNLFRVFPRQGHFGRVAAVKQVRVGRRHVGVIDRERATGTHDLGQRRLNQIPARHFVDFHRQYDVCQHVDLERVDCCPVDRPTATPRLHQPGVADSSGLDAKGDNAGEMVSNALTALTTARAARLQSCPNHAFS
jgi:hypothetical protein